MEFGQSQVPRFVRVFTVFLYCPKYAVFIFMQTGFSFLVSHSLPFSLRSFCSV